MPTIVEIKQNSYRSMELFAGGVTILPQKILTVFVWREKVRLNGFIRVGEVGQICLNQASF